MALSRQQQGSAAEATPRRPLSKLSRERVRRSVLGSQPRQDEAQEAQEAAAPAAASCQGPAPSLPARLPSAQGPSNHMTFAVAFLNSMHESVSTSDLTPDDKVRAVQLGTAKLAEQLGLNVDVGPFGAAEVGQRVRVYWEGNKRHFRGTVADFNPTTGHHQIAYDDGEQLWEVMVASTHEVSPTDRAASKKRPRQQTEQGADTLKKVATKATTHSARWLPFAEARAFARTLKLQGFKEWTHWTRQGERPSNIPSAPHTAYQKTGEWAGYRDWLGLPAEGLPQFLRFQEARAFVRSLGLRRTQDWEEWSKSGKRPSCIPSAPYQFYEKTGEWEGYRDWLGLPSVRPSQFLPFDEARAFVRTLGLQHQEEWRDWCKSGERPANIPSAPHQVYVKTGEWAGTRDWLGLPDDWQRQYMPFEEARAFARTLGLQSRSEWEEWSKRGERPPDIPSHPDRTYGKTGEWAGYRDWLGLPAEGPPRFLPFQEARAFVRNLGLHSSNEWEDWRMSGKRPSNIPSHPKDVYEKTGEWAGYQDWLGLPVRERPPFLPFEEARAFVHALGLRSEQEWRDWRCKQGKSLANIPADPATVYRRTGEWAGFRDWLGAPAFGTAGGRWPVHLPFEEARAFARTLGLKSAREWKSWSKTAERPASIPAGPEGVYGLTGEWAGFRDWLGLPARWHPDYLPFEEARAFVHTLGLRTDRQWRDWCKQGERPANIPTNPHLMYKSTGKWAGLRDWLGAPQPADEPSRRFLPFEEARAFVRSLELLGAREYYDWVKSGERPCNIPAAPQEVYKRTGEWAGYRDWLGLPPLYEFLAFEEARAIVHTVGLQSERDWQEWCSQGKRPANIPSNPADVYARTGEWAGFRDWLDLPR